MSEEIQKHLKPVGSRPGILYCFRKVRNKCVKSCPPFRPILSALKTPAHELTVFSVYFRAID